MNSNGNITTGTLTVSTGDSTLKLGNNASGTITRSGFGNNGDIDTTIAYVTGVLDSDGLIYASGLIAGGLAVTTTGGTEIKLGYNTSGTITRSGFGNNGDNTTIAYVSGNLDSNGNITTTGIVSANTLSATAATITVSKPLEMGFNAITTASADSSFAVKSKVNSTHSSPNVVVLDTSTFNNGVYRCTAVYLSNNTFSSPVTGIGEFFVIKTTANTNISTITARGTAVNYYIASGIYVVTTASVASGSGTTLFTEQLV